MLVYNIGLSAVQANQAALQAISNNIANANTEGYHRQQVNLAQTNPIVQHGLSFGTGVSVSTIRRMVDSAADTALTLNLSQSANSQAQLDVLQSIESLLTPSSGSLTTTVSKFFDSVEQLAVNPSDSTLRRNVVSAAQDVSQQITSLNSSLDLLQQQQATAINETVDQINSISSQIAAINKQIKVSIASGSQPNTLLDQRDHLVQQLGGLVDITPESLSTPGGAIQAAGGWLIVGDAPQQLSVVKSSDGTLKIQVGDRGPVEPVSGKLAGQLKGYHEIIPDVKNSLREWTSAFVSGVNSVQATGLGLNGPVSAFTGTTQFSNLSGSLASSGSLLPTQAGSLFISVTNAATGARNTYEVQIDPARDSLQDVVGRIDAIADVQASVSSSGEVRIAGNSGYLIDFAGRPGSSVDTSSISGTATPVVSGLFTGTQNASWTVTAESSGNVGLTDGLKLRVTDSTTGSTIALIDVGKDYAAGQPVPIGNGLSVTLGSGTLAAGDSFQVQAISDPDSSGFLTAAGIGGLLQTDDLRTITVNSAIAKDPSLLAASRNGDSGDASQLNRLIQLRTSAVLSSGSETIEERLASITGNSGLSVNSMQAQVNHLQSQYDQIRNRQDGVSGVDPNEELLSMLQFQRAFQANARFISTINDALDDLLGIIR